MKIVFLLNKLDVGGAERTVLALAEYFKKNNEIFIMCMSESVAYDIPDGIRIVNLGINDVFESGYERLKNAFIRTFCIRKAIRKINPDVVYCIMGINAKYLLGDFDRNYKLIVSERSNPKAYDKQTSKWLKRIYRKCDGIVFQTKRVCDLYPDIPKNKKIVIPNAVSNMDAYALHWQGRGSKRISAIGRLVAEKDYPTLIKAFSIFLRNHNDYILEIYGDGNERARIQDLINAKGLEKSIVLMGSRSDALECASKTECYVLSSVCEGMPNTLIEAMAIGMPCVSTDCEYGPAELIENGKNGLLVECNSPEKLAEALSKMTDDILFAEICAKAATSILEVQNIENIGQKYSSFFSTEGRRLAK